METKFEPVPAANKFGTLGGVFIPNVLTILGVIMFLRTGWVVGQAGLKDARIEATAVIVVSTDPLLATIARISEFSAVTFIGLNLPTNEQAEPLEPYAATVLGIKGNIFLAKSWEDLD